MKVVGLDLSLTSTGIAMIDDSRWSAIEVERVKSKGKKGATPAQTAARLGGILDEIELVCQIGQYGSDTVDLAVIESPSFGSVGGGQHERGGLWWAVAMTLTRLSIPIATVSPSGVKVYATGKGSGVEKDQVLAAVIKRYPDSDITGNDEADAAVLAAMGVRHLGHPWDELPATHTRAMDAAKWPT